MMQPDPDDALYDVFKLFNCTNFEKNFLNSYFSLTEEERMSFTHLICKTFGIAFKEMKENKENPFAECSYHPGLSQSNNSNFADIPNTPEELERNFPSWEEPEKKGGIG